jgi:hypothetical protein
VLRKICGFGEQGAEEDIWVWRAKCLGSNSVLESNVLMEI